MEIAGVKIEKGQTMRVTGIRPEPIDVVIGDVEAWGEFGVLITPAD